MDNDKPQAEVMNEKASKTFAGVTKAVNEKKKTADVLMSDETLDRDKEIILIDAWKAHLPTFLKHPVLLDSHRMSSNTDVLGRWHNVEARSGEGLFGKAEYFVEQEKEETPLKETVRWAWVLVRNGLGAYSVQFMIHKGIRGEELANFAGMIDPKILELEPYRVFTEVELLETSQVVVPANPSALLRSIETYEEGGNVVELGVAKGVFDKGILQLPKKTFLIQPPNISKASLRIRCEIDDLGLCDLFYKSGDKKPSALEISQCLDFSVVEPEPASEEFTVAPSMEGVIVEEKEPEITPEPKTDELSEDDLGGLEKALEGFKSEGEGEPDVDLGALEKVMSWGEVKQGTDHKTEKTEPEDEAYFLDKCLDIFGK